MIGLRRLLNTDKVSSFVPLLKLIEKTECAYGDWYKLPVVNSMSVNAIFTVQLYEVITKCISLSRS